MKITRLSVAGLRGFEQAQFEFDPAFTLLVGVNGVGKTTVLDAMRVGLSRILPKFTASRSRPDAFTTEDIRVGDSALTVSVDFIHEGVGHSWLLHKQREHNVSHKPGFVRDQTRETPDQESITPASTRAGSLLRKLDDRQSLGVYFGTRRSLSSDEQVKQTRASGGRLAAYTDALSTARPLRLAYFAEWMLAQEELSAELPRAVPHLHVFRGVARRLLPGCEDLRAERREGERPHLLVTKGTTSLDVRQLSDGERGMLALGLDLVQRLIQANSGLADPAREGEAVVLIDELDLHLHPKWQRQIVGLLTGAFPNCQFVATTHSPQIVGEVGRGQIRVLRNGVVFVPPRAFGVDSSRLLEELMETDPRNAKVQEEIGRISQLIAEGKTGEARTAIESLSMEIGADDPEIVRASSLLEFMAGDE